jgi:hypothetical protein
MQSPAGDAAIDRVRLHPKCDELPALNHAILPDGQRCQSTVDPARRGWSV